MNVVVVGFFVSTIEIEMETSMIHVESNVFGSADLVRLVGSMDDDVNDVSFSGCEKRDR